MLRKILSVFIVLMLSLAFTSCREKTPEEKIKDGFEEVGEGIKDAADNVAEDVEDAVDGE
jgi:hypothetical protein